MQSICTNCRYYLYERGGICGRGMSCAEQKAQNECSFKEVGPPAEVLGKVVSFWEITGNRRVDQLPKELRSPEFKVFHYTYTRTKEKSNTLVIVIEIAYESNHGVKAVFEILKKHVAFRGSSNRYPSSKIESESFGCNNYLKATYTINAYTEFQNKRLSPAAKRYKKRLITPSSKQLRLFKSKAYSSK